jgi:tRNA pseudouridine38-40 synthase
MRIALGLEYDGTAFSGWQSQPQGNTVQDALEAALAQIAGAPVRVACAGRTDAGVHAAAQVVHFDAPIERPPGAWVRGTNAHLPGSVAVRWIREVPEAFHARFSAIARGYRYVLYNHAVRPALLHGRVGWFHLPLDLDALRAAAAHLAGEHDFSAFRAAECQAKSPVKTLRRVEVSRQGDCFIFEFEANAFLHHMVRNMVGALVYVGKGKHAPEWIAELLQGRDRSRAAPTFSPAGLYLHGIEYDPRWQLPMNGRIIAPFDLPGA